MADANAPDKKIEKEPVTHPVGNGIVKAVTEGNRIVIRGPVPPVGPPPEKVIVLNGIRSPAVAKNQRLPDGTEKIGADEKAGFAAREFTRKMLIGKAVKFSMEHEFKTTNSSQWAGNIWLADETPGKDPGLIEKGLAAGWFNIADNNRFPSEEHKDLVLDAKNHERGQWNAENWMVRDVNWGPANARAAVALWSKNRGKELKGQVEFVLSASTIKVYLEESQTYVVLQLTGVQAVNKNEELHADLKRRVKNAAVIAEQARFFVESRLMHRDVTIRLDYAEEEKKDGEYAGMSPRIFGSIFHPKGNISELLLEEGFARCSDWSIKHYSNTKALRDAQNKAKGARKRVWAGYKAPTEGMKDSDRTFNAIVKQIVTTDSIIIRHAENTSQMKITFASTRQLNKTDFGDAWTAKIAKIEAEKQRNASSKTGVQRVPFSPITDIPVNHEAKEFLRKKLIGKRVRVTLDYKQESRTVEIDGRMQTFPNRTCATVHLGDTNIAEAMASRGYIKVINHGTNDDNRSSEYDALQAADQRAKEAKKGMYNSNISLPKINDISDKAKAGPFLSSFQRINSVTAVVEYVFSGNRLKCYIPKDNVNIMVILAGLEVPRVGKMVDGKRLPGEPFSAEAARFTSDRIMQQEVQLQVHSTDKFGSFIGYIHTPKMENMSTLLLQEGLAKTHFSAERLSSGHILFEAEAKAQQAKKNLWKDYNDAEDAQQAAGDALPDTLNLNKLIPAFDAVIADIRAPTEDDRAVYVAVQRTADQSKCETIQTELNTALIENPPLAGSFKPSRSQLIAAKWPEDEGWYRAKVDKIQVSSTSSEKFITVTFVDFGNSDTFKMVGRVGALPATLDEKAYRPIAACYPLAFLEYPRNEDYASICYEALVGELIDSRVTVSPLYKKSRALVPHVNLLDQNKDNILEFLIQNGQAMVEPDKWAPKTDAVVKQMKAYQKKENEAMRAHKCIWKYGDIRGDDCPEFGH